jgi:predicted metal-dependent phosphoesterase TrpH
VPRVEFHCHTSYSKDCLLSPRRLLECCARRGIDRVVVTDHNTIAGAVEAQSLDPDRVIVGEEIMTTHGELLAAFVTSEVPPGLSPQEAINRLRQQDAFISVSHPFDGCRNGGWIESDLTEILASVDAIEVFNSRCMLPVHNGRARRFARKHSLRGTVGSDAHTCWEVGRSVLLLPPFANANELRSVLRGAGSQTRWSPPWIHFASRYAVMRKRNRGQRDAAKDARG